MVVLFLLRRNQQTSLTLSYSLCMFGDATEFRFHLKPGQSHLCMCTKIKYGYVFANTQSKGQMCLFDPKCKSLQMSTSSLTWLCRRDHHCDCLPFSLPSIAFPKGNWGQAYTPAPWQGDVIQSWSEMLCFRQICYIATEYEQ